MYGGEGGPESEEESDGGLIRVPDGEAAAEPDGEATAGPDSESSSELEDELEVRPVLPGEKGGDAAADLLANKLSSLSDSSSFPLSELHG